MFQKLNPQSGIVFSSLAFYDLEKLWTFGVLGKLFYKKVFILGLPAVPSLLEHSYACFGENTTQVFALLSASLWCQCLTVGDYLVKGVCAMFYLCNYLGEILWNNSNIPFFPYTFTFNFYHPSMDFVCNYHYYYGDFLFPSFPLHILIRILHH